MVSKLEAKTTTCVVSSSPDSSTDAAAHVPKASFHLLWRISERPLHH